MTEDETYRLQPAYLLGAVDALRLALIEAVTQLPERAMHNIAAEVRANAMRREAEAGTRQNDISRDYASAAHDIADELAAAVEQRIDELAEGSVVRTVKPFPISERDRVPGRNF